jgi:hypothetical protein
MRHATDTRLGTLFELRDRVSRRVGAALLIGWFVASPAVATEYFVDFDATPGAACSDAGPGTDPRLGGLPWCTLPGTRVTANLPGFLPGPWTRIAAGDVVSIKAGTTHTSADDGGPVLIDPTYYDHGTEAARIVVRKHPEWGTGGYASFDGTDMATPKGAVVTDFAVDYLTLDGLEIYDSPDYGIQIDHDAHHVTVDHAYVHDGFTGEALVYISGCTTSPCMLIVRNSTVADCANGGGIFVYDNPGGYVLIENNLVHHICGGAGNFDGIQCGARDGTTNYCAFIGNVVYAHGDHAGYPGCPHTGSDPIDMSGAGCHRGALLDGNEVYDSGGRFLMHGSYEDNCHDALESYGIARRNRFTNLQAVTYSYPNDTIFYNNTFYNPDIDANVQIYSTEAEEPPGSSYGTESHGPRASAVGRDVDFARLTFKNNIMWGQTSYHVQLNGVVGSRNDVRYSSLRFYYNLYRGYRANYWYANDTDEDTTFYPTLAGFLGSRALDPPDVGSLFSSAPSDAVFVAAADRDYRLVPGSPAIDAGTAITHAVGGSAGGANGSVVLTVERASFVDGWRGLVAPDHISVGDCPEVAISGIDDFAATILLAAPCRWTDGAPINLATQRGAPDLGAYEFAGGSTGSPTPVATPVVTCADCGPCAVCDLEDRCVAAPRANCRQPTAAGAARLRLKTKRGPQLAWTWTKGAATGSGDFGDVIGGERLALCIFDESGATPRVAFAAVTRPGRCGRKPCWQTVKPKGFKYKDAEHLPNGLATLALRPGIDGKARIVVTGAGPLLPLPALPLAVPARVQLRAAGGQCWEARYTSGGIKRNTSTELTATSVVP